METALNFEVHACTDITGFGILGHSFEMARGSGVQFELVYDRLPFYPHARQMYRKGETTGSNKANRQLVGGHWEGVKSMALEEEELLFDPQTSGGLLLSVPETEADELVEALQAAGVDTAVRVGKVVGGERPLVRVV